MSKAVTSTNTAPKQQAMGGAKTDSALGLALPASLNIAGMNFTFANDKQYRYYVPHPMDKCACCCVPCPGEEATFKKRFFMEFENEGHLIKYTVPLPSKKGCVAKLCDKNIYFSEVYQGTNRESLTHVGNLYLPKPCMPPCCDCEACSDKDKLLMSFATPDDTELLTIRKKGEGCSLGCCVGTCCPCGRLCGCDEKNMKDSVPCCGSFKYMTEMHEVFDVYGPMTEPSDTPKANLTLVNRRGFMYGMNYIPQALTMDSKEQLSDDKIMLLLGFAYGQMYQSLSPLNPWPIFTGKFGYPNLVDKE